MRSSKTNISASQGVECRRIRSVPEEKEAIFCWQAIDRPLPGESLWSVLHKFCARNALAGDEAIQTLAGLSDHKTLQQYARSNLRDAPPELWALRLGEATRIDVDDIRAGTVHGLLGGLVNLAEPDLISSANLRFCPHCIQQGHHSVASQLYFQTECFIHGCALRDTCPRCTSRIPYRMPTSFGMSYACPTCGNELWSRRTAIRASQPNADEASSTGLQKLIGRIKQWTNHGLRLGTPSIFAFGLEKDGERWVHGHGPYMQDYFDAVGPRNGQGTCARLRHTIIHVASDEMGPAEEYEKFILQIRPCYKTVLRWLLKRLTREQRAMANDLCRADWRDRSFQEYKDIYGTEKMPPAVYALISWRMLWEQAESPAKLLRRLVERPCKISPRGRRKHCVRNWAQAVAEQFTEYFRVVWQEGVSSQTRLNIDERVFASACVDTFRHILALYERSHQQTGKSSWIDCRLNPAIAPMYLLQIRNSDEFRLQWFELPSA